MIIVDENNNIIQNPDLDNGYLIDCKIAKPNAYDTIDNITKFALNDNDYIEVQRYIPINPIEKEKQMKRIQQENFLNTGQQQLTDIMQAIAELGVLITQNK